MKNFENGLKSKKTTLHLSKIYNKKKYNRIKKTYDLFGKNFILAKNLQNLASLVHFYFLDYSKYIESLANLLF